LGLPAELFSVKYLTSQQPIAVIIESLMREIMTVDGEWECRNASGRECRAAHWFVPVCVLLMVAFAGPSTTTLAAKLSQGHTRSIVFTPDTLQSLQVDWQEIRCWNISKAVILPGTILWNLQPIVLIRQDREYFIAGLALILFEAFIIALLLQRARRRKSDFRALESEKSFRLRALESEGSFRLLANATPTLVWMCDSKGNVTYVNDRWIAFTGSDPAAGLGSGWSAFIHPDDLEKVLTTNALALKYREMSPMDYRLRRHDGLYRWMLDVATPRISSDGLFSGFIGSAMDITDQKAAQEALEKIGGRLIEAQEEERSRIARELHDDICQRLALLSMKLEQVDRTPNDSIHPLSPRINEIRRHCAKIAIDVQALSHKLHSSKLEYLGIAAAVRSFCHEYCEQYPVSIEFNEENVPRFLPREISLSLFRVTQEALQNARKHSGVSQFSVSLRGMPDEIQLEISDRGSGFDVEKAKGTNGLGLISMQERIHWAHGVFTIRSEVNRGTSVLARIPVPTEIKASENSAKSVGVEA